MEEMIKAFMSLHECNKELTADLYSLETKVRQLKKKVIEAAIYSAEHGFGSGVDWKDIASIMEFDDAFEAYKEVKEAKEAKEAKDEPV